MGKKQIEIYGIRSLERKSIIVTIVQTAEFKKVGFKK